MLGAITSTECRPDRGQPYVVNILENDVASDVYATSCAPDVEIVDVWTLDWPNTVIEIEGEGDESNALRAAGATSADAVPDYFIDTFDEYDTLGFSGGIPGPNGVVDASTAGVVVAVEAHLAANAQDLEIRLFGETVAHELGLLHTTEHTGTEHEPVGDTPECSLSDDGDGTVTAEECESAGAT